jgi:hypothetical protein
MIVLWPWQQPCENAVRSGTPIHMVHEMVQTIRTSFPLTDQTLSPYISTSSSLPPSPLSFLLDLKCKFETVLRMQPLETSQSASGYRQLVGGADRGLDLMQGRER